MKRFITALCLAGLVVLAACSSKSETTDETTSPSPSTSEPIVTVPAISTDTPAPSETASPSPSEQLDLVWIPQTVEYSWAAEDDTVLMTARYVLPATEHPEADPAWAIITSYYEEVGQSYIQAAQMYADFAAEDYEMADVYGYSFSPYSEEASYEVSYQTDSTVSFVRAVYTNTGGSYPSILQYSEVFNLNNGEKLTFDDFFSDSDTARTLVLESIHAVTDGMDEIYAEDVDSFFQPDQFYLTTEGFVFYYQVGTLGPHALGIPEFSVPYTQLSDVMVR